MEITEAGVQKLISQNVELVEQLRAKDDTIAMLHKAIQNADEENRKLRNKHVEEKPNLKGMRLVRHQCMQPLGDSISMEMAIPAETEKSPDEGAEDLQKECIRLKHDNYDLGLDKELYRNKWITGNAVNFELEKQLLACKKALKSSAVLNIVLGIATVVFAYFTNF